MISIISPQGATSALLLPPYKSCSELKATRLDPNRERCRLLTRRKQENDGRMGCQVCKVPLNGMFNLYLSRLGRVHPRINPLPFYELILPAKVPFSYTLYRQNNGTLLTYLVSNLGSLLTVCCKCIFL